MSQPYLHLSLLNGDLKATLGGGSGPGATWLRPEPLIDIEALAEPLQEAVEKTRATRKQVAIVFADARLSDQFVELPQARGSTLRRLLARAVNRVKAFPGEAAWSSQPAVPSKRGSTALLHLCPKSVVDQLRQSCQGANLELVRLLPTTGVLVSHLKTLPLQKEEVALIVAESGRSTTIVVGRKDGRMCLGRVLPVTWKTSPERVWMDVARSIGFAEQQSPVTVSSVWLFGEGAGAQLATAQATLKTPVKVSPVPYSPFYWTEQAAKLPDKDDGNLISDEIRAAPKRQRFMTVTAMLVLLLLIGAGAATLVLEAFRRSELQGLDQAKRQITRIRNETAELQKLYGELEQMRKTSDFIESKLPPAPEWFLAYLGQALPPELALTRLRVWRTNDAWSVQLAGTAEARTNIAEKFDAFCTNLAASSFKLTIADQDIGLPAIPTPPAGQPTPAPVKPTRPPSKLPANTFLINGVMR